MISPASVTISALIRPVAKSRVRYYDDFHKMRIENCHLIILNLYLIAGKKCLCLLLLTQMLESDDDFANTWLEKTKFITVEPLPNKLRLVEIARQEVVSNFIVQ